MVGKAVFKCKYLLLLFIIAFWWQNNIFVSAANAHTKRKKLDRVWRAKRRDCIMDDCKTFHQDENDNCVNKCTSVNCFNTIYGDEPLEPGEVDFHRWRLFTTCARKEVSDFKKKQREEGYKKRNDMYKSA